MSIAIWIFFSLKIMWNGNDVSMCWIQFEAIIAKENLKLCAFGFCHVALLFLLISIGKKKTFRIVYTSHPCYNFRANPMAYCVRMWAVYWMVSRSMKKFDETIEQRKIMNILVGKRAWNIFAIFGQLSIVVGSRYQKGFSSNAYKYTYIYVDE